MSANNCTLVHRFRKKFYIFQNVNAESWGDGKNRLSLKDAVGPFNIIEDAIHKAFELNREDETEYGVCFERLSKDGAKVKIIE